MDHCRDPLWGPFLFLMLDASLLNRVTLLRHDFLLLIGAFAGKSLRKTRIFHLS
jgi:hypothetical protein